MGGGGSSKPKKPEPAPKPAPRVDDEDENVRAAQELARKKSRKRKGRLSTLLAGRNSKPSTLYGQKKTLGE